MSLLHENLPKKTIKEIVTVFENHFKQWHADASLMCVVAGDPPFATMACKCLFNLPMNNDSVKTTFCTSSADLLPMCAFLFQKSNMDSLKQNTMFKEHIIALLKVATCTHLFEPEQNDAEALSLERCLKCHALPILSNAQHIESKIKDVSLCKTVGRSELTTTYLHSTRSQLTNDVSEATRIDEEHINRKKKSAKEDVNYLPGKHFNKNMLIHCESYFNVPHAKDKFFLQECLA